MRVAVLNQQERSHLGHHKGLNLNFLRAFQLEKGYPRHSHDYYVIAVVDSGLQSFLHGGTRYITPVDGLILLNPGEVHTGEPVDGQGYAYRAFYPTAEHMAMIAAEFGEGELPMFTVPRADDRRMTESVRGLLDALQNDDNPLECETRLLSTLAE